MITARVWYFWREKSSDRGERVRDGFCKGWLREGGNARCTVHMRRLHSSAFLVYSISAVNFLTSSAQDSRITSIQRERANKLPSLRPLSSASSTSLLFLWRWLSSSTVSSQSSQFIHRDKNSPTKQQSSGRP